MLISTELCVPSYFALRDYAINKLDDVVNNNTITTEDLEVIVEITADRLHYGNSMNNVMESVNEFYAGDYGEFCSMFEEDEFRADEFNINKNFIEGNLLYGIDGLYNTCKGRNIKIN